MILDVEKRDGEVVKYMSPIEILSDKILEAVVKRANSAFEVLSITKKGLEELEQTLAICEKLVGDLRYVHKYVRPCFPERVRVFDLYRVKYEEIFSERIDGFLDVMDTMIQREPSTVLAFNKFVSLMKEVMKEFDF